MDNQNIMVPIKNLQRNIASALVRMPAVLGNEGLNFALDNFRRQGFLGNTFEPWPRRKPGWRRDKRTGRHILVNTGRLRRAGRIVRLSKEMVVLGWDVPYARAHNEGITGIGVIQSVKGFTRRNGSPVKPFTRRINIKLPRRRFIGNSPYLETRLKRVANLEFMKALKQY